MSRRDPRVVRIGKTDFLRFYDVNGRPRQVNVENLNGFSPDNLCPGWTAIFTAEAKQPMISPFPVELFDRLGVSRDDAADETPD